MKERWLDFFVLLTSKQGGLREQKPGRMAVFRGQKTKKSSHLVFRNINY
jgi:hypothetical protein